MNHYEILGIERTATRSEIRAAYLQLVQDAHPDRHVGDPNFSERDERLFKRIHAAYEVLHDVERRRQYDRHRWIPSAGSAGKPVVTPVRSGRHDLPSEWLERVNSQASKAKPKALYWNLVCLLLLVFVGVGIQEFHRYKIEQFEVNNPVDVGTLAQVEVAGRHYPDLELDSDLPLPLPPDLAVEAAGAETYVTGPDRSTKPAGAEGNRWTATERPLREDFVVSTVAWNDPIQQRLNEVPIDAVELDPFAGIPSVDANRLDWELDPSLFTSPNTILPTLGESPVSSFEESIQRLPDVNPPLDEYKSAESQTFDFPATPPRSTYRKKRPGSSSFRASWQNTQSSPNPLHPSRQRGSMTFERPLHGAQTHLFDGGREGTSEVIAGPPRGFRSTVAVLSRRRESSSQVGAQDETPLSRYDMSLPESAYNMPDSPYEAFKSPSTNLTAPTWTRPSWEGFRKGRSLPSWHEPVGPDPR